MPETPAPNRPKRRPGGQDLVTDPLRRRRLGGAFDQDQSLEQAREYDAVRPRYPQAAVEAILRLAEPPPQALRSAGTFASNSHGAQAHVIAELGAGTGILTRELLRGGAQVHAVEPSATMLQVLGERAASAAGAESEAAESEVAEGGDPGERLVLHRRSAEDTGLADSSVDLVVAAQAWHWFDPERIQHELRRVLVPRGAVAVVGNYLDTSVPWVHRLTRIMRAGDVYRPQWQPRLDAPGFTPVQTEVFQHSREVTPEDILRLATTLSSWLAANDEQRATRRQNLDWYLYEHLDYAPGQVLQLPYLTTLHTARLR